MGVFGCIAGRVVVPPTLLWDGSIAGEKITLYTVAHITKLKQSKEKTHRNKKDPHATTQNGSSIIDSQIML